MKQPIRKRLLDEGVAKKEEKPILTLVIDGNSVLKQSLVNETIGTNGRSYGGVLQTFITIKRLMKMRDWNFVYIVFDGDNSGQLRYNFYPEYKQNRDKNFKSNSESKSAYDKAIDDFCKRTLEYYNSKRYKGNKREKRQETEDESFQYQRSVLIDMCECLSMRVLMYDEVEGDDIIAYIVKNKEQQEKVCIVSNDRDLTQLISEDICVYIPQKKEIVTDTNSVEKLGYTYENVVIYKMLCGDSSDNIKGISGMGEGTFFKYFPNAKKDKIDLNYIFEQSRLINEERVQNKQKPLKVLENVLNNVTTGCQGSLVYEVNEKLIDLTKYILLTKEAEEDLKNVIGAPLDPEGRDFKSLYEIVQANGMSELITDNKFSSFFSDFAKLQDNERKYYEKWQ